MKKRKPAGRAKPHYRGARTLRRPAAETTAIVVRDPQGLLPSPAVPMVLPPIVASGGLMAQGLSRFKATKAQVSAIERAFPDHQISLLPAGEIFIQHALLRKRLNEVFGPGTWALDPRDELLVRDSEKRVDLQQKFVLLVDGQVATPFVIGEATYFKTNPRHSFARAWEAVRSMAIRRCCKELGIGLDCWLDDVGYRVKMQFGIRVNVRMKKRVKTAQGWTDQWKLTPQWRRYDRKPLEFEVGLHQDSPNKDKYAGAPKPDERAAAQGENEPDLELEYRHDQTDYSDTPPPSVREQTTTGAPEKDTRPLSEGQVKRLHAIAGELKRDKARLKAWIQATYHVESSKEIPRWQYEDLVSCIEEGSCYLEPGSDG